MLLEQDTTVIRVGDGQVRRTFPLPVIAAPLCLCVSVCVSVCHFSQSHSYPVAKLTSRCGALLSLCLSLSLSLSQPPPPANALSLEAYLGLAAARCNLSGVNRRKVKVTPKMRQEWARQGKLLEF